MLDRRIFKPGEAKMIKRFKTNLKDTPIASIDDLGLPVYDRVGRMWIIDAFPALSQIRLRTPAGHRYPGERIIACTSTLYTRERPGLWTRLKNKIYYEVL